MKPIIRLTRSESYKWAIVSRDGGLCYRVATRRRDAINEFMNLINCQSGRENETWKEVRKWAVPIKVKIVPV